MKKLSLILASALLLGGISFASPIVKQAAPAKTGKAAPAKGAKTVSTKGTKGTPAKGTKGTSAKGTKGTKATGAASGVKKAPVKKAGASKKVTK